MVVLSIIQYGRVPPFQPILRALWIYLARDWALKQYARKAFSQANEEADRKSGCAWGLYSHTFSVLDELYKKPNYLIEITYGRLATIRDGITAILASMGGSNFYKNVLDNIHREEY